MPGFGTATRLPNLSPVVRIREIASMHRPYRYKAPVSQMDDISIPIKDNGMITKLKIGTNNRL